MGRHRPSFHDLVSRTAKGEEEAFEILYDESVPRIVNHLIRKFQDLDWCDAEAIAQQTMLRVWEKAHTYEGKSDISAWAWIRTIATNKAFDLLRILSRKLKFERQEAVWIEGLRNSRTRAIEDYIEDREAFEEHRKMIKAALTRREFEVFMYLINDFSPTEIAELLRLSEPRISQLSKSARTKAQNILRGRSTGTE